MVWRRGRKQLHHACPIVYILRRSWWVGKMIRTTKPCICPPLFPRKAPEARGGLFVWSWAGLCVGGAAWGLSCFSYLLVRSVSVCVLEGLLGLNPGVLRPSLWCLVHEELALDFERRRTPEPPSLHLDAAALPAAGDKAMPSFLSNAIFIGNLRHPATRSFLFLTTLSIRLWRPGLVQIDPAAFLKALQNKPHCDDWVFWCRGKWNSFYWWNLAISTFCSCRDWILTTPVSHNGQDCVFTRAPVTL